ncbi:hypothetical protein GCM10007939_12720 [Amylibacter marinus]|uniref:Uncharacterized protein n=1 Tax=Amylibacter marinus TaxID=1475483 RepID=A0ABQ5VUI5_9RHOB|nr:hypothetical protein [Amylibacter marinus]GLQ34989.1 hypothetical protein GCM10007939_12720 [Amylibacter marinus]
MKYIAPTAALVMSATQAVGGTLTDPAVEEIIEPATQAGSSANWIIPVLMIGAVAALASRSGNDPEQEPEESCMYISIGCE